MTERHDARRDRRAALLVYLHEAATRSDHGWALIRLLTAHPSAEQYDILSLHFNAASGAARAAAGIVNELLLELDSHASALRAADGVITELLRQLYPDTPIEPGSAIGLAQAQIRAAIHAGQR